MNLLNRYFTPFAALMIGFAIYFRGLDAFHGTDPQDIQDRHAIVLSAVVWLASFLVNWWFAANTYRFVGWAGRLKSLQVWLNFIWAVPLFYLLQGFWGPIWLLFVMAPVTAAMYMGWWQTLGTSIVAAGTMLGMYWLHGLEGAPAWGMAGTHAAFIIIFSLFVNSLAQTALRLASR